MNFFAILFVAFYLIVALDTFSDALYVWKHTNVNTEDGSDISDLKNGLGAKIGYFTIAIVLSLLWVIWIPFVIFGKHE